MSIASVSTVISNGLFLSFVAGIPLYAACKKVPVYETFVDGAKDGFTLAVKIIPYLVGMVVAIGMFRAAGGFTLLAHWFAPLLRLLGVPEPVLPLALIRPFSGSASNSLLVGLIHQYGPNSFIAHVGATMMGSTETTFYVVAIYFAAANIRRTRHAIPAGLIADFVGVVASVWICRLVFLHS